MINRENYEIWFLDYFEGDLSEEDIRILYDFLDKNPELKEEFDDFELLTLDAGKATFNKKDNLKQNLNIDTIADLDEFETLAVKDLEGEINKTEKAELNSILRFSEEKNKEFLAFNHTILKPEKDLIYKNKRSLKRKTDIVVPMWVKIVTSVAAVLLLLVFAKSIINDNSTKIENNTKIVENDHKNLKNNVDKINEKIIVEDITQKKKNSTKDISLKYVKNQKSRNNSGEKTQKELRKEENKNNLIAYSVVDISIPERKSSFKINNPAPALKSIVLLQGNTPKIITKPEKTEIVEALTPKQFLIKTVKTKLEIDNKDYNKINPIEIASASLEKLNIAKMDYKEESKSKRKHFALNIRGFEVERSWVSN